MRSYLIETLLGITILLAIIISFLTLNRLLLEQAREAKFLSDLNLLKTALRIFAVDNQRPPKSLKEIISPEKKLLKIGDKTFIEFHKGKFYLTSPWYTRIGLINCKEERLPCCKRDRDSLFITLQIKTRSKRIPPAVIRAIDNKIDDGNLQKGNVFRYGPLLCIRVKI